jgi:ribosomal protein RSM22 (predicted rRNA methylase)
MAATKSTAGSVIASLPQPLVSATQRAVDFRLDTALRDACESDLKNTCGVSLEDMDSDEKIKKKGLDCLQQYKEELKSDKCRCRSCMGGVAHDLG